MRELGARNTWIASTFGTPHCAARFNHPYTPAESWCDHQRQTVRIGTVMGYGLELRQ